VGFGPRDEVAKWAGPATGEVGRAGAGRRRPLLFAARRCHYGPGSMRARAPASSANLGPGFDALAVALACYVEVSVEPAPRLEVHTTGCGADLPADASHLAARVAIDINQHDHLRIDVHSDIPLARGLGSSAALAVAAAAAAGAADPFAYGVAIDGHPENAAASAFGGLVVATTVAGRPLYRRLPLDPSLRFVVVVPDRHLATDAARAALPTTVPRADAAFNLGRMGLLLAGLADAGELVSAAGEDRLHQDARTSLFPEAPAILAGLGAAGALMSCWSGAGPSLLAVCREGAATAVRQAGERLLETCDVPGEVRLLAVDLGGVTVSRSAGG
jgi:homoserine kinase